MKIYTRTGDSGTTGLFGAGRVSKNHPRIEAYGTVDELNATIGIARAAISDNQHMNGLLTSIQEELFRIGSDLATPEESDASVPRVTRREIDDLEMAIDRVESELQPLKAFILPAGTALASALHLSRTVCRRAERRVVELAESASINENVAIYLNRLADLLFVLARAANARSGSSDEKWKGL
ncbi:MAG: cob(I)yrinic acid a,c-diamide adenosyltransferase [Rhodothermia bacterium]|nr:cob(I)yrinic acid a,c-diamide adenosyltransferase [Rhodothermia bacterium]